MSPDFRVNFSALIGFRSTPGLSIPSRMRRNLSSVSSQSFRSGLTLFKSFVDWDCEPELLSINGGSVLALECTMKLLKITGRLVVDRETSTE